VKIVFVLGLPRSGTSLVQNLISQETDLRGLTFQDVGINTKVIPNRILRYHKTIKDDTSLTEVGDWDKPLEDLREYMGIRSSKWVLKSIDIDKIPQYMHVFPEARFVNCYRDPSKIWASVKDYFASTGLRWPYNPVKYTELWAKYVVAQPEKFDVVDVEKLPQWSSTREPEPTKVSEEVKRQFDVIRGYSKNVKFDQFKHRYSAE
jgi:hypothetical protein